jgi:hypothetical protein
LPGQLPVLILLLCPVSPSPTSIWPKSPLSLGCRSALLTSTFPTLRPTWAARASNSVGDGGTPWGVTARSRAARVPAPACSSWNAPMASACSLGSPSGSPYESALCRFTAPCWTSYTSVRQLGPRRSPLAATSPGCQINWLPSATTPAK